MLSQYLLKDLTIKDKIIRNRSVLAPMAGLGHIALRHLIAEFGGFGLLFTGMCSAKAIPYENPNTSMVFNWRQQELGYLVCQIFGSEVKAMADAAEQIEKHGFFGVDLNFGCSVSAICKKGSGAALLRNPKLCSKIVKAVRKSVSIPVFVKFRIGWENNPQFAADMAARFEDAGADALTFHPRIAPDRRNRPPKWDVIKLVKQAVCIPVIVDQVRAKLLEKEYKIAAIVHAETSTGVKNPVFEIGQLLKENNTIYLVDAVTSFGGIGIDMDDWRIDVLYSGTQKCLSCPPGLSPVSFSSRAVKAIQQRKTKVPNWYLDLTMIMNYWEGDTRAYHHTAPINMLYGLYQALSLIFKEGELNVYKRHMDNHLLLVDGLKQIGIDMLVDKSFRLPMLNSVHIPKGADDAAVRNKLLTEYKIEIGAGLGPLAGKIWRIGLMGHTARQENIEKLLTALKTVL